MGWARKWIRGDGERGGRRERNKKKKTTRATISLLNSETSNDIAVQSKRQKNEVKIGGRVFSVQVKL